MRQTFPRPSWPTVRLPDRQLHSDASTSRRSDLTGAMDDMLSEYGLGPAGLDTHWEFGEEDAAGRDVVLRELPCGLAHELVDGELTTERLHGRLSFSAFMLACLDRLRHGKKK
jgi:hypothetical protein